MFKIMMFMSVWLFSMLSYGYPLTIDVHGTSDEQSTVLIQKYQERIHQMVSLMHIDDEDKMPKKTLEASRQLIRTLHDALVADIKKEGPFEAVVINGVIYPETKTMNITIDVVQKNASGQAYVNNADEPKYTPKNPPDLIDEMVEYQQKNVAVLAKNNTGLETTHCPVYHCVGDGFDDASLKPYLKRFNLGVIKERTLVLETLNHDASSIRRAAAAFLLGHLKNPHEIIKLLWPKIQDPSEGVRNNAMRVIAATIGHSNIKHVDIKPLIGLLKSPYDSDRNKAMYILYEMDFTPKDKHQLIQEAGQQFIALLKLKQPNNHYVAYVLLKKLSGKDYGEHAVESWSRWVTSAQRGMV